MSNSTLEELNKRERMRDRNSSQSCLHLRNSEHSLSLDLNQETASFQSHMIQTVNDCTVQSLAKLTFFSNTHEMFFVLTVKTSTEQTNSHTVTHFIVILFLTCNHMITDLT